MDVLTAAHDYTNRGFFCVPIPHGEKGPRLKGWQNLRLTTEQLGTEFMPNSNVGVILGEASGWLIDVDLDCEEAVTLAEQYLPPTGMITGRDGRPRSHWWYVCEGAETVRLKEQSTGATIVELRSSGLQTVVGPSVHPDGGRYDVLSGEPARVPYPMLRACVDALHAAALKERGNDESANSGATPSRAHQQHAGQLDDRRDDHLCDGALHRPLVQGNGDHQRPGDAYNETGDLRALLEQHGWRVAGQGADGNIQLTRPGKTHGISATYKDGVFFLFSSSVPGLEPDKGYSPFEVYTRLEHNGDHSAAAAELARQGYGEKPDYGVDLSGLSVGTSGNNPVDDRRADAGHPDCERGALNERNRSDYPEVVDDGVDGCDARVCDSADDRPDDRESQTAMPEHLLRVPGFLDEYVEHSLETAYSAQPVLTLFGGICLQASLAGRKITDPYGNQTSLYVIAMAGSGKGKNHPRMINRRLLDAAGSGIEGPEDIASDAGLLTAIHENPSVLLQLDEAGRLLKAVSSAGAGAAHLYNITTLLLRLYSCIGSVYKGKAYGESKKTVDVYMPCPTLYGSTVPDSFWGAMSSESIGDGFLARLIPVLGTTDPVRNLPTSKPLPQRLVDHVRDWDRRTHGDGNLTSSHPMPEVIEYTPEATELAWLKSEDWYERGEKSGEWQPVWTRCGEKAARLALVYAASRSVESPIVDAEAYQWAAEVAEWSTSLFESVGAQHIADSQHERNCQRAYQAIKQRGQMTHGQLVRHRCFRSLPRRDREEIITTLTEAEKIAVTEGTRGGRVYVAL